MENTTPWPLGLQSASREEAEQAFSAAGVRDPEGLATPHSMAAAGRCLRLTTLSGTVLLSVGQEGRALWCYGAAGTGRDMCPPSFAALEWIARRAGLQAVAFQTLRRGLVKRAGALGYRVMCATGAGFTLQKDIA